MSKKDAVRMVTMTDFWQGLHALCLAGNLPSTLVDMSHSCQRYYGRDPHKAITARLGLPHGPQDQESGCHANCLPAGLSSSCWTGVLSDHLATSAIIEYL